MKTNKNRRQLRLDQRFYYAAVVNSTNETITFWIWGLLRQLETEVSNNRIEIRTF